MLFNRFNYFVGDFSLLPFQHRCQLSISDHRVSRMSQRNKGQLSIHLRFYDIFVSKWRLPRIFLFSPFPLERVCSMRSISHRINSYSAILDQSGLRLAEVWRACQTRREILPYASRMKEDRERCLLNFLANSNGARMRGTQHLPRINSHSAIFDQSNLSLNGASIARVPDT